MALTFKKKREILFANALAELEARWRKFEKPLLIFQWAWEFLRRNPYYIQAIKELEAEAEQQRLTHVQILSAKQKNLITRHAPFDLFKISSVFQSVKAQQIAANVGLSVLRHPDSEMPEDIYWGYDLIGKVQSDYRLEQAKDEEARTITDLQYFSDEEIIILNFNTPYYIYQELIETKYKEREKLERKKQSFPIELFPVYLKIYDLRTWGTEDGKEPQIGWERIARYLDPENPPPVSTVKKRYAAAKDLIEGGYKSLLRHKSHTDAKNDNETGG